MAFWVCDQHASINTHAASSCAAQIGSDACAIHFPGAEHCRRAMMHTALCQVATSGRGVVRSKVGNSSALNVLLPAAHAAVIWLRQQAAPRAPCHRACGHKHLSAVVRE